MDYSTYDVDEIEIRFGKFNNNYFTSSISEEKFKDVLNHYKEGYEEVFDERLLLIDKDSKYTVTTDKIYKSIRDPYTSLRETTFNNHPSVVFYSTKRSLKKVDLKELNVRISKSNEVQLPQKPLNNEFERKVQYQRIKDRRSFIDGSFRVDLTIIINPDNTKTFEIECEIIDNVTHKIVVDQINKINKLMDKSNQIYEPLYSYMSFVLKKQITTPQEIHRALASKPVPFEMNSFDKIVTNKYIVSKKADGERIILVNYDEKQYHISSKQIVVTDVSQLKNLFFGNFNFVFDCERIGYGKDSYLLVFDFLVFGNEDLRKHSLSQRLSFLHKYQKYYTSDIRIKDYQWLSPPDILFETINSMLDKPSEFKTDGLIFTPNDDTNKIYKWKPPTLNTIDMLYKDGKLYVGDVNNILIDMAVIMKDEFGIHPIKFNKSMLNSNIIYEFNFDKNSNSFILHKQRDDKIKPNFYTVAISVMRNILNPITDETIRGIDLKYMRRIHNKCKREIISKIPGKVLLDIGSGRGGDLSKWSNFSKILCVEPNKDNLQEFVRRMLEDSYIQNDKVFTKDMQTIVICQTYGQDTTGILNDLTAYFGSTKVDVISMFDSMTFFFDTPKSIESLQLLIKETNPTYFIGKYMDIKTLSPPFSLIYDSWELHSIDVQENRSYGNKVKIIIPDSIVETQEEYVVDFDLLANQLLSQNSMRLKTKDPLDPDIIDDEYLSTLSTSQRELSKKYIMFVFVSNTPQITKDTSTLEDKLEKLSLNNDKIVKYNEEGGDRYQKYKRDLDKIYGREFKEAKERDKKYDWSLKDDYDGWFKESDEFKNFDISLYKSKISKLELPTNKDTLTSPNILITPEYMKFMVISGEKYKHISVIDGDVHHAIVRCMSKKYMDKFESIDTEGFHTIPSKLFVDRVRYIEKLGLSKDSIIDICTKLDATIVIHQNNDIEHPVTIGSGKRKARVISYDEGKYWCSLIN